MAEALSLASRACELSVDIWFLLLVVILEAEFAVLPRTVCSTFLGELAQEARDERTLRWKVVESRSAVTLSHKFIADDYLCLRN